MNQSQPQQLHAAAKIRGAAATVRCLTPDDAATRAHYAPMNVAGIAQVAFAGCEANSDFREAASQCTPYLLFAPRGVLYDDTLWWRWLLHMLSRFGLHVASDAFTSLWERDYLEDVCRGRRDYFDALQEFLKACGLHCGQIDELLAAGRPHWRKLELELHPFPQTISVLSLLQQRGWRMGLMTHSALSAEQTQTQLTNMGIQAFFDPVIDARHFDGDASDSQYWTCVMQSLSLSMKEVIFVGHDPQMLTQAKAAGLRTVACRSRSVAADAYVNGLAELCSLSSSPGTHQFAA